MFRYLIGGTLIFCLSLAILYFGLRYFFSIRSKSWLRRVAVILALLVTIMFLIRLPASYNSQQATLYPADGRNRIVFTGKRLEQGDSFWARAFPKLQADTFWVEVKRTQGHLTNKDITAHSGNYLVFGKIDMSEHALSLELYYDNAANKSTDPLTWNGNYSLVRSPEMQE